LQDFFIQRIKVIFIWKHLESKLSEMLQKKTYHQHLKICDFRGFCVK